MGKTEDGGRYSGETARSILKHIKDTAPESFLPAEESVPQYESKLLISQLSCSNCCMVLNQPVELTCGSIVCASCCCQWIKYSKPPSIPCPTCYDDELNSSTIRPPPPLLTTLLSDLLLHCAKYAMLVEVSEYIRHLDINCEQFSQPVMNSPSKVTLKDVLSKPVSTTATPMERRVTEHLVRRLLDESPEEKVIKVPTRDQVSCDNVCSHKCTCTFTCNLHVYYNISASNLCATKWLSHIKWSRKHKNSSATNSSAM